MIITKLSILLNNVLDKESALTPRFKANKGWEKDDLTILIPKIDLFCLPLRNLLVTQVVDLMCYSILYR